MRLALWLTVVLAAGICQSVHAASPDEVSFQRAAMAGLTPMWSRAITVGTAGRVTGVAIHASTENSYKASEVVDRLGRRVYFSDRDRNAGTSRAGYDQRSRLAEIKSAELAAQGLDPKIEEKTIRDVTLYVRSSHGTVIALDAESGRELWSTQAGKAGYPSYGISASETHVVTLSGSTVYVLDPRNGDVLDTIRTRKAPGASPTLYEGFVYVPTLQGLVEVYSLEDTSRVEYTVGSSGDINDSVTPSPYSVSWTTDHGFVYVGSVGLPGVRYRFHALDSITSAPVYMDKMLFATSIDGFTYAIDEQDGAQKWGFSAGGTTVGAPMAFEGHVYVTTDLGQIACLDATTGEPNWRGRGIHDFVAISDARLYGLSRGGDLVVLDRKTGTRLQSLPVGTQTTPVLNLTTDRIYLVSARGIVQGLRETGQRWPTVRMPPVRESTAKEGDISDELQPTSPSATEDAASPDVGGEDPFGDIAAAAAGDDPVDDAGGDDFGADEEDPFAVDGGMDDDLGGDDAAGDDEDPFADFE